MHNSYQPYCGLTAIPGVRFAQCSTVGNFIYPFCGDGSVAIIGGKLSFTARMSSNDILADTEYPLCGFRLSDFNGMADEKWACFREGEEQSADRPEW